MYRCIYIHQYHNVMNKLSAKEEMQLLIQQCIDTNSMQDAYESLKIYEKTFGTDSFTLNCHKSVYSHGPLVSLICLNCSDTKTDTFLSVQNYSNLEVVRTSAEDSFKDIIEYISAAPSKYICFLEENHAYSPDKIANMVWYLEKNSTTDIAISPRNFIDASDTIIAHPDYEYQNSLKNNLFNGKLFLEYCITENQNLYGTLSTIMVSTKYARMIPWKVPSDLQNPISRLSFLHQFLLHGNLSFIDTALVSAILEEYKDSRHIQQAYEKYLDSMVSQNLIAPHENLKAEALPPSSPIPRNITFFYTDKGEYYNLVPIADEAAKRGYQVNFTENLTQKADIGVYCQHVCYPENSKFSLILLHDLAQGHNRWPNLWELERWNKFDIGIVPGKTWADLWSQCACQYYVNPRQGAFELGYPKSDLISDESLKKRAEELRLQFNLKYNFSVLYAPSWENDEKEDDFIRALASLNVNLLIKQAHWPRSYQQIIDNIKEMRALHENKYDNVYYIEPEESIMTALELCDMVVSDESSVMSEAIMFGKPSVAVTDWLIPDTVPSRFASVPMDYVLKCKKVELREYVEKLSSHSTSYEAALKKGRLVFSNQGSCCKDIMDAVEYYTQMKKTDCAFLDKKLSSRYTICSMWN